MTGEPVGCRAGDVEIGDELPIGVVVDWKPAREGLGVTYVVETSPGEFEDHTYWLDEMIYAVAPIGGLTETASWLDERL